jgi:tripartite ATP-independent transporter DctP family solute receptor
MCACTSNRLRVLLHTALAVLLVALAPPAVAGTKIIRLGDSGTEANPQYLAHQFFAKRVAELTNGQVEVKIFMNAQLGGHTQMNEQVASGALEVSKTAAAFMSTYDKRLSIWSLPYSFASLDKFFAAQDGKLGQAYGALAEKYGFKLLGIYHAGTRDIYNKKGPIRTPEDLKKMGIRLRSMPDPVMIDTFNTLGAQATPLEANEVYNAIQQGVIDGAENSITWYLTMKHFEVAPFFSLTHHFYDANPLFASLKWFNQQPPDIQKALLQAGKETIPFERKAWAEDEQKNYEKAKAAGIKINDADIAAFQKAAKPVLEKYAPSLGELYPILKEYQ